MRAICVCDALRGVCLSILIPFMDVVLGKRSRVHKYEYTIGVAEVFNARAMFNGAER